MAFKLKMIHILVIGMAILLLSTYGYINLSGIIPQPPAQVVPGPTPGPISPTAPTLLPAVLRWVIKDAINGTDIGTSATAYVDICKADQNGLFDPLVTFDSQEYASTPDYSAEAVSQGDWLLIHVSSDRDATFGYEQYSRWFYILGVDDSASMKELTMAQLQVAQTSPTYKYRIVDTGAFINTVKYLGGTTPYWDLGSFPLYSRVAKDYLIQSIVYNGVVLATLNDGASWEDDQSEITDATLADDYEDIKLEFIAEDSDVVFGLPQLFIQQNGKINQYDSFIVVAFNTTKLGVSEFTTKGWTPCNVPSLYAGAAYYRKVSPQIPNRGEKFSFSVNVPIDASAQSTTVFCIMAWIVDVQLEANIAMGSISTSLPTVYGFITAAGLGSIVEPLALTTSSGKPATPQMMADITPV